MIVVYHSVDVISYAAKYYNMCFCSEINRSIFFFFLFFNTGVLRIIMTELIIMSATDIFKVKELVEIASIVTTRKGIFFFLIYVFRDPLNQKTVF